MAYYDSEINIVNDLCECDNSEIFIFNGNDEEILQCVRKVEEWQCSSSKSDPPPDFYSDKYKLMMEVMRVDDHAYINAKGKVINPHIKKENETYKEIQKFVKDNNISFSGNIFVNAGNSGGPLINAKGELLGINTYANDNASIGMSISAESLNNIINNLLTKKSAEYLNGKRPENALSVVLNEIGYMTDDIYNQNEIIESNIIKSTTKNSGNNNDNKGNVPNGGSKVSTTTEFRKSHDSSLAKINIDGYNIDFSATKTNYKVELKNQESSLNLQVNTNDVKAKYVIKGNTDLNAGKNMITIIVTAEDDTTTEYKIIVVKSLVDISRAKGIIPGLDVQYSSAKNTNCFKLTWDYEDSDGIRVYTTDLIDSTVYDNVSLNIYAGWNESKNVSSLRLLKKYNLNYSEIKQKIIEIPINDIRSLLTDSDYEGGFYAGADLSFELIIKTKKYGIFKEVLPWGLTK